MSNGLLKYLPPAPISKTGWPWTEESKPLHPLMPNGKPWPRISIVTPSYNQGQFIEETIRSVLLQNYPNLEYIIMDGGSTDNSVEIIKKYGKYLSYWTSEKDNGQADAIAKGFAQTTGYVIGWVNSDDYLLPCALQNVGRFFAEHSEVNFIVGSGIVVDTKGRLIRKYFSFPQSFESLLVGGQFFMQVSSFWRREAYEEVGGLDTSLRFAFDYELFLRLARRFPLRGINALLSAFRIHEQSKSSTIWETVALPEIAEIQRRHGIKRFAKSECQRLHDETVAEFYRLNRRRILLDLYLDPRYFFHCLRNKLTGRPGSTLIGLSSSIKK
jgi:glycosyltransferase involved in cell wall biosynthesis